MDMLVLVFVVLVLAVVVVNNACNECPKIEPTIVHSVHKAVPS